MGLTDYFTGIIFNPPDQAFGKTQKAFFDLAQLATGLKRPEYAYFIDDSVLNVFMAMNCGWHGVIYYNARYHKPLPDYYAPFKTQVSRISLLKHIRRLHPELFSKKKQQS